MHDQVKKLPQIQRWIYAVGTLVALSVLGATILAGSLYIRSIARNQIIKRDAAAVYATMHMEFIYGLDADGFSGLDERKIGFNAAVHASRLKGVIGIRFFSPEGTFYDAFPASILPVSLSGDALKAIQHIEPYGEYVEALALDQIFIYRSEFDVGSVEEGAILSVTVPIHREQSTELIGGAQFLIEGSGILAEFSALDRHLLKIALLTFLAAGGVLVIMLVPAFARIDRLNVRLADHGEALQKANIELALSARVSALGAVSAHLMHGLRNPLASLSQFVRFGEADQGELGEEDWKDALDAARRMQTMVEHTVQVIRDAEGGPAYHVRADELGQEVIRRVHEKAVEKGVALQERILTDASLPSRVYNLVGLILENLLDNAIKASESGMKVQLCGSQDQQNKMLCFVVSDEGPGFSDAQKNRIFQPGPSGCEGGAGIGLAISKQIADSIGASLSLQSSSSAGAKMKLLLPEDSIWQQAPTGAMSPAEKNTVGACAHSAHENYTECLNSRG